jgi:hypothetical protein
VVENKLLGSLIVGFLLQGFGHAADKIRIAYPVAAGHFMTLPLAEKLSGGRTQHHSEKDQGKAGRGQASDRGRDQS